MDQKSIVMGDGEIKQKNKNKNKKTKRDTCTGVTGIWNRGVKKTKGG